MSGAHGLPGVPHPLVSGLAQGGRRGLWRCQRPWEDSEMTTRPTKRRRKVGLPAAGRVPNPDISPIEVNR